MSKTILVPTDFSEVCRNAADQAAEAARIFNYQLILLHIINQDTKAFLKRESADLALIDQMLEEQAIDLRNRFGIDVETRAMEGSIFTTISEIARDLEAGLIFMGTHGKVGMQHLTGSYALKVITGSPVPVIVVQQRKVERYRNIVLPITSEAGPWEKTKWAVFISRTFLATIHMYMADTEKEEVKNAVNTIGQYFEKNDVPYTLKIAEKSSGFTAQVITYATSINADMIMIMTNPDKSFTNFLLGTYDEEIILNSSQIPVMCINPRRFNYEILGL
ncbi:MAG TPA: universal stress protein [Bacteroidales bacterium]|nr:universal stress protein [Bacteroidales bacterium]